MVGAVEIVKCYGKLATVAVGYTGIGTDESYEAGTDVAPGTVFGVVSSSESPVDVVVNAICIIE